MVRKIQPVQIPEAKKQFALYVEPAVYHKLVKKLNLSSHAEMVVAILQDVMGPKFTSQFSGRWPAKFRKAHNIKPKGREIPSRGRMLGITTWLPAEIINKAIGISREKRTTLQRLMRDRAYQMVGQTPPPLLKRGPRPAPIFQKPVVNVGPVVVKALAAKNIAATMTKKAPAGADAAKPKGDVDTKKPEAKASIASKKQSSVKKY
jgi:hypothetical protein